MPSKSYKPELHSGLPYIDKEYKKMLDLLAEKDKRSLKAELEYIIQETFAREEIPTKDTVYLNPDYDFKG